LNSRERLLAAIRGEEPDMVPVGLHCIDTYLPHMAKLLGRPISDLEALKMLGLDPTLYRGYSRREKSPDWREREQVVRKDADGTVVRKIIETPRGVLTTLEKRTQITTWTIEPLLKTAEDLELLRFRPLDIPDPNPYRKEFKARGPEGIVRVGVWGQGEAVTLRGPYQLCKDFHLRPDWVKELYRMLTDRALAWIEGLPTDFVDLVEISGHIGNFVSPEIYRRLILPFDREVIRAIKSRGLGSSYHDCGRVMHVIELIASTGTDCIETLTPPPFGGDVDLSRAKELVGHKVCLIGGFHQSLIERGSTQQITHRVKECINSAAHGGGYILYNTDHFFEAPIENIKAYVAAARRYGTYS